MDELIKRLEAACGADRDADYIIAELVFPILKDFQRDGPGWYSPRDGKIAPPYEYTASIDAALTLVPEGWSRAVDATAPEMGIEVTLFPHDNTTEVVGDHTSEAVATCIASIMARARTATGGV